MKAARAAGFAVFAVSLAIAGCSDSESVVRVLDEPKPTHTLPAAIPNSQKQFRTLAAMFPRDDAEEVQKKEPNGSWWFFKLSGPADVVAKYEADFFKVIDSVRFPANAERPITWELPEGWREEAGGAMRHATLKTPDGAAEIAVSSSGGVVLSNVQRWWGQLWGQEKGTEVTAINLFDYARQRTVNGRLAITVDLAGPKNPNAKAPGGPMMNPHGGK